MGDRPAVEGWCEGDGAVRKMIKILNLGAGVQSSTIALKIAAGEFDSIDHAIFADTGWEPKPVYEWLHDYLIPRLPFPVHIVGKGNLREAQVTARSIGHKTAGAGRWGSLPYYTLSPEGKRGMVRRQCTSEYKIIPIERKVRELMGLKFRQWYPKTLAVEQWIGISIDEIQRIKVSVDAWRIYRHPLIEAKMSRQDCLAWLAKHGHPQAPRSACIGCPFHSNHEWRDMRDTRPDEWADAISFDSAIRIAKGMDSTSYVHAQRVPLAEVDLSIKPKGQMSWDDECGGVCGV